MIDFRYHLVSIVAVFLALAVGITLGSTALRGPIVANLSGNVGKLTQENQNLRSQLRHAQGQSGVAGGFAAAVAPALLRGRLAGHSVDLISMPDAAAQQRDAVVGFLRKSGATVPAELQVTGGFTDPRKGGEIRDLVAQLLPPGAQIPDTGDAVAQGSALLATVLARPDHGAPVSRATRDSVLGGFENLGVLRSANPVTSPADAVVVLTGPARGAGSPSKDAAVPLVTQLHKAFRCTVVAGPADKSDVVAAVRGTPALATAVSSVDNVDTAPGQLATVLALAGELTGRVGAYGTGDGATLVPPLSG